MQKRGSAGICDNVDRPSGYNANEISQSEKDKYHIFHLYVESENTKQNKTNKQTDRQTHKQREQTGVCQRAGRWVEGCNRRRGLRDTNSQL